MARKAARITMERFEEIVEAAQGEEDEYSCGPFDICELPERIAKDLGKVDFDGENQNWDDDGQPDNWHGFQMIGDLPVLGASAGGDWEWPVYFIIYWDGKRLRGYIPKQGNMWNFDTKCALGNDEYADPRFLHKIVKKKFPDEEIEEHECTTYDLSVDTLMLDVVAMKADVQKRIKVQ